ncbi:MAG: bifunctional sulfate adenylyltransferase/adenylylsulfate kinase [Acidobacteria bacterium]|nr:bifunctional sulfate adenylyltransferase/adenylylsulfate kinase [Acidobacteriota bacterium]
MSAVEPHGGQLINGVLAESEAQALWRKYHLVPSLSLSSRQLCDLELILNGGFSPLDRFMGQADYTSVLKEMRLPDGVLFPLPVTLDLTEDQLQKLGSSPDLILTDREGMPLALLHLTEIWQPDKKAEALAIFGTLDEDHPGVYQLLHETGSFYVSGALSGFCLPKHYDFVPYRLSPRELRAQFQKLGWSRVVAFQTRNPIHRAHRELTVAASAEAQANLLLHPVVGMTKPGDVDHFTRVRCYKRVLEHYPLGTAMLSLLPLAMRMAGPREALFHALIRKNYGCTHFIVGRDHAGPGCDRKGQRYYAPYAAQDLIRRHESELGIEMVPFRNRVYVPTRAEYVPEDDVAEGEFAQDISGTELRRRLQHGLAIPDWYTYPQVIEELRKAYPERKKQGFTVFFTGLSGAGKSTIANALLAYLMEEGSRPITLLDGDIVRTHLSSELGFSREHRDLNIMRIGFVASEITKNRGIALCAPIAPYAATRRKVRNLIQGYGGFIEVHVATTLAVCESRDRKGLYAKARKGIIKGFTGIDDPYEEPENPEIRLETAGRSVEECLQDVILYLEREGYFG